MLVFNDMQYKQGLGIRKMHNNNNMYDDMHNEIYDNKVNEGISNNA